jgi:hypothetical protein
MALTITRPSAPSAAGPGISQRGAAKSVGLTQTWLPVTSALSSASHPAQSSGTQLSAVLPIVPGFLTKPVAHAETLESWVLVHEYLRRVIIKRSRSQNRM